MSIPGKSILVLTLATGVHCAGAAERKFEPRVVIQRAFAAITNAPVLSADKASERVVRSNELVLGVVVNGKARAYPINMLTGPKREIINDALGSSLLVATFDPETTEAHCFERVLDGRTLVFESGEDARRMRDRLTGSEWHSESGLCLSGVLKGRQLREIPSIVSFRRAWFGFHPESREFGK